MPESTGAEIRPLDSAQKSQTPSGAATSDNLPLNVSMQLYKLMQEVVKNKVSPKTVQAACACASEIHKIIKLNFEMTKAKR